jgi:hypothetical protein
MRGADTAREDKSLNPHVRSAVSAGALLVLASGAALLFSTLNQPNLALVGIAPLLPFIFGIGGGVHGSSRPEWLVYTVAFLVWWMVIDLSPGLFRVPRRMHAVAAFALPAAWYLVVAVFVFVVPRFQTSDVDPIPELTGVQEVCRIDGKWLGPYGPGNQPLAGDAARFALLSDSSKNHWLLDSTDCALREVKLPATRASEWIEFVTVTNNAEVLFTVNGVADLPVEFVLLDVSTGEAKRSPVIQDHKTPIILRFSNDGARAAWMTEYFTERTRVHGAPVGAVEAEFSFAPSARLGVDVYDLIDVGRSGREILLQRDRGEYLLVDTLGSLIRTLKTDEGIRPSGYDIRFSHDGSAYLAWNDDEEHGPPIVQWRIADRLVRKELPQYSTVVSAAVSPDWTWMAASSRANTKAGRGVESLTVWSADGTVRFHKRLRDGARTPVVFLDGDLVAYNEVDQKWHGATRVVRLTRTATTHTQSAGTPY